MTNQPIEFKCPRCGATANRRTGVQFTQNGLFAHLRSCPIPAASLPQETGRNPAAGSLPQEVNEIKAGEAGTPAYISSSSEEVIKADAASSGVESNKPIYTPIPPRSVLARLWSRHRGVLNTFQSTMLRTYLAGKTITEGQWAGVYGAIEVLEEAERERVKEDEAKNYTAHRGKKEADEKAAREAEWADWLVVPDKPVSEWKEGDDPFMQPKTLVTRTSDEDLKKHGISRRMAEQITEMIRRKPIEEETAVEPEKVEPVAQVESDAPVIIEETEAELFTDQTRKKERKD
jgi:hypothetical protein